MVSRPPTIKKTAGNFFIARKTGTECPPFLPPGYPLPAPLLFGVTRFSFPPLAHILRSHHYCKRPGGRELQTAWGSDSWPAQRPDTHGYRQPRLIPCMWSLSLSEPGGAVDNISRPRTLLRLLPNKQTNQGNFKRSNSLLELLF